MMQASLRADGEAEAKSMETPEEVMAQANKIYGVEKGFKEAEAAIKARAKTGPQVKKHIEPKQKRITIGRSELHSLLIEYCSAVYQAPIDAEIGFEMLSDQAGQLQCINIHYKEKVADAAQEPK